MFELGKAFPGPVPHREGAIIRGLIMKAVSVVVHTEGRYKHKGLIFR